MGTDSTLTLEDAIGADLTVDCLAFLSVPSACSIMRTSHRFADLLKKSLLRKTTLALSRTHWVLTCNKIPHEDIANALCALCPNLEVIEDRHVEEFARYEFSSDQVRSPKQCIRNIKKKTRVQWRIFNRRAMHTLRLDLKNYEDPRILNSLRF